MEQKDAKITEVYHEIDKNFRKHVSESFGEVDKTLTDLNQRSSSLAEQFNNLRQICLSQSEQENVNKKEHTLMSTIKSDLMDLKERMNRLEKPKESFINLESLTVSAFKSVN